MRHIPTSSSIHAANDTVPTVDVVTAANRPVDVLLVDVREHDEWSSGHAPGALHRPLGVLEPSSLPACEKVFVICRSGNRSATATRQLREAGIDAYNVTGGIIAWADAHLSTDVG